MAIIAPSYSCFAFLASAQPCIISVKNFLIGAIAFSNTLPKVSFKSPIAFCNCFFVSTVACASPLYFSPKISTAFPLSSSSFVKAFNSAFCCPSLPIFPLSVAFNCVTAWSKDIAPLADISEAVAIIFITSASVLPVAINCVICGIISSSPRFDTFCISLAKSFNALLADPET